MASNGKDPQATQDQDQVQVTNLSFISELPFSVLSEIFFKLPIKSIICCKCVCKPWLNLVSDPNFSEEYAKYSKITRLLVFPCKLSLHVIYLLEFSENGDFNRTLIHLKLPDWLKKESEISVVGVCNGFLCLRFSWSNCERQVICVTNPITGDSIVLPELELKSHGYAKYCFGFDPSRNLFKVLRIIYKPDHTSECDLEECAIFAVGVDDGWRILSISVIDLNYWEDATVFNGAFYWIHWGNRCPASLSTFDLAEEKLGQLSIPPDVSIIDLGVFSNQLYLIDVTDSAEIFLCTMKRSSTVESWTNIALLKSWLPADLQWYSLLPIAELQDGEILFKARGKSYLISCNVNQKKCSIIDISAAEGFGIHDIQAYDPKFSRFA